MKKIYSILILLSLIFSSQISWSQIVTTSPSFPTENAETTITFDAGLGNQELKDFTGDVYAHTGVITDNSTSGSDWKYVISDWAVNVDKIKMTSLGNNKWELKITPDVRSYYSVPAGEEIQKMAFVFRNANGSKVGKDTGDKDIFIDISTEGLNVSFSSPQSNSIIEKSTDFTVTVNSAASNNLKLYVDGILNETTSTTSISKTFNYSTAGNHEFVTVATAGSEEKRDTVKVVIRQDTQIETRPSGLKDGINYISDTEVTLQLYAPFKNYVYLIGDFNNWLLSNNYQMKKDDGYFWFTLSNLTPSKEYVFQYYIDGQIKIADPYADKLLDPWNDKYITDEVYPNLIAYPSDKTSEFASVLQTAQTDFAWDDAGFTMPDHDDLVIYELLIRDFTAAGDLKTVTDTLDYLQRLGVNAIELMPFNEFEGNDSWGYNPAFYFAPDKAYGTKNDYKTFINECHKRGIAVIMDMVLNHSFGQSPFFRMYEEGGKPSAENPWYNREHNFEKSLFHWGADFNHESLETQKLVDRINTYWMNEYHIDGYRFDFTKGFSNKYHSNSQDEWGNNYDADRVRLLKRMVDKIWEANPNAFVSFEHLSDNYEEKELAAYGIHLWGKATENYNEATMGFNENGKSDLSWTSWKEREWVAPRLISYMESHDEERLMVKNLEFGNSSGDYNVKNLPIALSRIETAAAFFLTIPGPKMIWQFGELGYDISIDENGRTGKKPIKWEYQDNPNRKRVYQIFAALAKIKKEEAAFKSDDFTLTTNQLLKRIEINHADMDVRIIGNFDVKKGSISAKFSKTGTWYDYISGKEINVTDADASIALAPGAYHIYTTKQLTTPHVISSPVATHALIAGTAKENETLTASYTYSDVNGDVEGTSVYRWYRADDINGLNEIGINGASNTSYTLGADDRHKFIRFSVTPVAQTGELLSGKTIYSDYSDAIISLVNAPVASNLALSGELIQDAVLKAAYIYSDVEGDIEGSSIIEWYRSNDQSGTNETAILGANSREYTISREDVGRYLRFAVTPVALTGELLTGNKVYSDYSQAIDYATGIEDVLDKELSIYPNPVKDLLHLDNLNQVKRISLYSLTGRSILYKEAPNSNEILNVGHLSQGTYIMVFELEDGSKSTRKVVKQ